MSPNSATAERLEGVAREQCFELKSSNDAISGSDGGWCRAGKVAGCAVRDKDRTSAPEMNLPQGMYTRLPFTDAITASVIWYSDSTAVE